MPKEKLIVRVMTRSFGIIQSHTYETRDQLLNNLFKGRVADLIHYEGVDELEQQVDHWFLPEGPSAAGQPEIGGLIVVKMASGKITPVDLRFAPGKDPRRG